VTLPTGEPTPKVVFDMSDEIETHVDEEIVSGGQ
jgi:hypothetical protein